MKLILETTDTKYYLTSSREYYHTVDNEELIVLRDRLGYLPDWVYTLSCAERLGIIQHAEGNRVVVGTERNIQLRQITKVTCRF